MILIHNVQILCARESLRQGVCPVDLCLCSPSTGPSTVSAQEVDWTELNRPMRSGKKKVLSSTAFKTGDLIFSPDASSPHTQILHYYNYKVSFNNFTTSSPLIFNGYKIFHSTCYEHLSSYRFWVLKRFPSGEFPFVQFMRPSDSLHCLLWYFVW